MPEPEIRCIVGAVDAWEVVSSRRCCVFRWQRLGQTGMVMLDSRCCSACRAEVRVYANSRGWRVLEA